MSTAATFPAAESIPRARRTSAAVHRTATTTRAESGRHHRPVGSRQPVGGRASMRLTRRGRLVLGVLVSLPCAALLVITGSVSADAGTEFIARAATAVVVVQPGESLWQIARAVDPTSDPRSTVVAIRELNGLGTDTVVPGQSLIVPQ